VDCPLDVCEARELTRGDRLIGLARSEATVVHRHPHYIASVDTSALTPDEAASITLAAALR
jgi:chloramphenicol 3-O-phosphotransferase